MNPELNTEPSRLVTDLEPRNMEELLALHVFDLCLFLMPASVAQSVSLRVFKLLCFFEAHPELNPNPSSLVTSIFKRESRHASGEPRPIEELIAIRVFELLPCSLAERVCHPALKLFLILRPLIFTVLIFAHETKRLLAICAVFLRGVLFCRPFEETMRDCRKIYNIRLLEARHEQN